MLTIALAALLGFTGSALADAAPGLVITHFASPQPLDRMHRLYPDAEWVSTGNADSNGPMLAINKRMGFKRHRWGAEYQITRDNLAERVQVLV